MTRRVSGYLVLVAALLAAPAAGAKNLLSADGPGGTYELIRTAYSTEVPDCGHMVPHITEEMDGELGKPVFIFHAHINEDDDRCGAIDRQRTEIRGKAADVVANNGETVYYRWKFKLADGFKGCPSFTHIFQIKSDLGAPVMTLTPRTSTLAIDGRIGARGATNLSKFIGAWVVVDLKVLFSHQGSVAMTIRKLAGGEVLFNYAGAADTWDDNASAHDPKWGIYRSLNNRGMLRDEQVRFADFCVSKTSATECDDGSGPPPPPADAGAATPDAGASAPDTGTARPDARAAEPDTGTTSPDPMPTPKPDAAGPSPRADAGASKPPVEEPSEPAPTDPTPRAAKASGCNVAGSGSGGLLLILAGAFGLMRGRRRRG